MKPLLTIDKCQVWQTVERTITWTGDAMIDSDGAPNNPHKDPTWQPETSLTYRGQPINALTVPYVVLPPEVIKAVPGIVLGCEAWITNTVNGKTCLCVVADVGPHNKLGEISIAAAEAIGIPSNARTGGTSKPIVLYSVTPDRAAVINGVRYTLKPFRA